MPNISSRLLKTLDTPAETPRTRGLGGNRRQPALTLGTDPLCVCTLLPLLCTSPTADQICSPCTAGMAHQSDVCGMGGCRRVIFTQDLHSPACSSIAQQGARLAESCYPAILACSVSLNLRRQPVRTTVQKPLLWMYNYSSLDENIN
ncbi:hypothetical protein JZ751_029934 [Albula glossodonta]|uniref:Uncharacterized protein n=1 Tax=Albula glossodonta TaxID=121402 RepID=A0A8T2MVM2_9TELE|nr:hypothetical protein JZ751_029934 [Albula glossodonta]